MSQATVTGKLPQPLPTIRLSDVKQCAVRWLWDGFIAFGKVSMIAGNPGLGKSQITASLAATVSIGGVLPMSQTRVEHGYYRALQEPIRSEISSAGIFL